MQHPLQSKIRVIRRRVRQLFWVFAASTLIAGVLGVALLLGVFDYLIRFQDPGLRWLASLTLLGVAGWVLVRYAWTAWQTPLNDLQIARRIEDRHPHLVDRLTSTVDFLARRADDPTAGSLQLRKAVINQTTVDIDDLTWQDVVDPQPVRRVCQAAVLVCLLAAAVVLVNPTVASIAAQRMLQPWGGPQWPRTHNLSLVDAPRRVALGQPFEVLVRDSGPRLPQFLRVEWRTEDPQQGRQLEIVQVEVPEGAQEVAIRRPPVVKSFAVRVTGGDDSTMPWHQVGVVEPPRLEEFSVRVQPPAYTGYSPYQAEGTIRAIRGSRIQIGGSTTKPLASALLHLESVADLSAILKDSGKAFLIEFLAQESAPYSLQLTDVDQFTGGPTTQGQLQVIADQAPEVIVERPTQQHAVTAKAVVPLEITARDDLALHRVTLQVRHLPSPSGSADQRGTEQNRSSGSPEPGADHPSNGAADGEVKDRLNDEMPSVDRVVRLVDAGPRPAPADWVTPEVVASGEGDRRQIDHRWDLQEFGLPLVPGDEVEFFVEAVDYLPQAGRSQPQRLIVLTERQMTERLAARQSAILGELDRLVKLQRQVQQETRDLEIQLQRVGSLDRADRSQLQGVELTQRQVQRGLSEAEGGIPQIIRQLQQSLEDNRINDPETSTRLEALAQRIAALNAKELPQIGRDLTQAVKSARRLNSQDPTNQPGPTQQTDPQNQQKSQQQSRSQTNSGQPRTPSSNDQQAAQDKAAPSPRRLAENLNRVGQAQAQVTDELQKMLDELFRWDNARRFRQDLEEIRRQQQGLAERTAEQIPKTLTQDFEGLGPQAQAELTKLSQRQRALADAVAQWSRRAAQTLGELDSQEARSAHSLSDTLAATEESNIAGRMSQAARDVQQNQVGQAASSQQKLAEELEGLLNVLANRPETDKARLLKKLQQAERELATLQDRQQGLGRNLRRAGQGGDPAQRQGELDRLGRQQQELADRTERLARQLQRLQARKASQSAQGAGQSMKSAASQARKASQGNQQARGQQEENQLDGPNNASSSEGSQAGGGEKPQNSQDQTQQAAKQAEQAQQELDKAEQELANRRREVEGELAFEQLLKIQDRLTGLRDRQQRVVVEVQELAALAGQQGELSEAQRLSVRDLSATENLLREETDDLAATLNSARVFRLALDGAAAQMQQAADLLSLGRTDQPVRDAAEYAATRLAQLLEALDLKAEMQQASAKQNSGAGQQPKTQQSQGPRPPQDGVPALAQIKMLKLLQQDLNQRAATLQQQAAEGRPLSAEHQRAYDRLSREQGRLADLVLELLDPDLLAPPEPSPEPESTRLPRNPRSLNSPKRWFHTE